MELACLAHKYGLRPNEAVNADRAVLSKFIINSDELKEIPQKHIRRHHEKSILDS